jgi:excisionase family DNA binding protein
MKYLTVSEFLATGVPLGRGALYTLLRKNGIPSIRLGKKFLIPEDALERMEQQRQYEEVNDDTE